MVKKFLLLILFSINSFSQDIKIHLKDGNVIEAKNDSFDVTIKDERIMYVPIGKNWEKYFKYKDFEFVDLFGDALFKSFRIKNRYEAFFVRYTSVNYQFTTRVYTVDFNASKGYTVASRTFYQIYIFDLKGDLIDTVEYKDKYGEAKFTEFLSAIKNLAVKYFKDEMLLIETLKTNSDTKTFINKNNKLN